MMNRPFHSPVCVECSDPSKVARYWGNSFCEECYLAAIRELKKFAPIEVKKRSVHRVVVDMDFDFDSFESLSHEDKFAAIKEVLLKGAEATQSHIDVHTITIKDVKSYDS